MRAQVSLEFIITMGVAALMLVGFLAVGSYQLQSAAADQRLSITQDIGLTVQQELVTAQAVNDGYHRTFELPKTLLNKPYTITMQQAGAASVITLNASGTALSVRAPICVGHLQPGENNITKQGGQLLCNP